MQYESFKEGGKISVRASAEIPTSPAVVLQSHEDREFAPAFRDIGKYTLFERDGDVIRTAFPARIGFVRFPMTINKRIGRVVGGSGEVTGHVDFWSPSSAVAPISGRWTVRGHGAGSLVTLEQSVQVPAWAKLLPLESSIKARVARAIEDLARL